MLICPECQSGNPDSNKFCQHCGTSLVNTNCHNCGAEISLIALECEHCQTPNASQLVALVVVDSIVNSPPELVTNLGTRGESQDLPPLVQSDKQLLLETIREQHLDSQQRYHLIPDLELELSNTFPDGSETEIFEALVTDKFPLKQSYLKELQKEQKDLFTDLEQELNDSYLSVSQYWNTIGVPSVALPYLILQDYTPVIPPIYDAWQDRDLGALLLPNRSSWQLLTDLWSAENVPWEQVLWSLNEIVKYWTPLAKIGCARTLLVKENLRIDEDHSLGFQKLYLDLPGEQPTLADLAIKWREWFDSKTLNNNSELVAILEKAIAKKLATVNDFRQELYALADSSAAVAIEEIDTTESDLNTENWLEQQQDIFHFDRDGIDSMLSDSSTEDMPTASLAMQIASVTEASCTDVGTQRDHNEDFFGTKTTLTQEENPSSRQVKVKGLYVVCDGMGGHSAGEVASAMAVETIQSYFYTYWQDELPDENTIKDGILLANRTIYQTNVDHERSGNGMMGTTLVMALLQDNNLAIAHVGDSRIYRITRSQGLEQLTQDHEVGQREINRGIEPEIAYGRPDAYQLTQALGPRENKYIKPAIQFLNIQEDCLLLLCSDGLSDNDLIEKHWETYLQPLMSSSSDLQSGLFKLIDFADRYNGHDNITGILLRIKLQPNFET